MKKYCVQIIHKETGKIEEDMRDMSFEKAERVKRGASINLDHEHYKVVIKSQEEEQKE